MTGTVQVAVTPICQKPGLPRGTGGSSTGGGYRHPRRGDLFEQEILRDRGPVLLIDLLLFARLQRRRELVAERAVQRHDREQVGVDRGVCQLRGAQRGDGGGDVGARRLRDRDELSPAA